MKKRDFYIIFFGVIFVVLILPLIIPSKEFSCQVPDCYKTESIDVPKNWVEKIRDDPVATFTLLFTGGLFWATYALWAATKNLVEGAEATSRRQLRAYVSIKNFGVAPVVDDNGRTISCEISVNLINTGTTPTKDLVIHTNVWHEDRELPSDFRFPDTWIVGRTQAYVPMILFPGSEQSDGNFRFSIFQIRQIERREMFMYIYGYADYNDVFNGTYRHRTEFCVQVNCVGDASRPSNANLAFNAYPEHNGADSECMRKPVPLRVVRRRILPLSKETR